MNITCPKCGRLTEPDAPHCSRCGAEIGQAAIAAATAPNPALEAQPCDQNEEPTCLGNEPTVAVLRPAVERPVVERSEIHRSEVQIRQVMNDSIGYTDRRIERMSSDDELHRKQSGVPSLEIDKLCVLFENQSNNIRFQFDPNSGTVHLRNVVFVFENQFSGQRFSTRPILSLNRRRPFPVQFPPQPAGTQAWNVTIEFNDGRRRRRFEGDFEVVVCRPQEASQIAQSLSITIDNSVKFGDHSGNAADVAVRGSLIGDHSANAADIQMKKDIVESLSKLAKSQNPFDELRNLVQSDKRAWSRIECYDADAVAALPPMPPNAQTEHIVMDMNGKRMQFFAKRTVKFGRNKESNDFWLRPAPGATELQVIPYKKISREHCSFEHSGQAVTITDGNRNQFGQIQPSTGGTFWNNEQMRGSVTIPVGTTGIVSFGGIHYGDNLSLDVKVCEPVKACATCPHADKHWCGEGKLPTLMLTRRDGIPERFIALWSCFWLGDADPSFEGTVIFRKDGAFAYRTDDGRTGWLVPGSVVNTDYGPATIS